MDIQFAIDNIVPNLLKQIGITNYHVEPMTLQLGTGGTDEASVKYDAGNTYMLVVNSLPKGIRIKSHLGVYDANGISQREQQEIHTGVVQVDSYLAIPTSIQLIKVNGIN